jgi:SAM-dependent methyltransferase
MLPSHIGRQYDAIASRWDRGMIDSQYGLAYLRRAMALASRRGSALDVGCGSGGRIVSELLGNGFDVLGIDASEQMVELARRKHPESPFLVEDICIWTPPEPADLVIAWDSIFHVPYREQRAVVHKLCRSLASGGVLLFTAGGSDGELSGEMHGHTFTYSSLADAEYLEIINGESCRCVLLERDQFPDEHVVIMAVKPLDHVTRNG